MKNRIQRICHPDMVDANIKKLHEIFWQNSYPKQMLDKLMYETDRVSITESRRKPEQIENIVQDDPVIKYGSLPNIGNLTSKIKNCFKDEKVKISTYNTKTIKMLYSKLKDTTPNPLKSNVVYKIKCSECDGTYVGQTSQWLKSRLTLHKIPIGAKTAKKSEKKTATAKQAKPNHPPTSEMVNNAIKDLKERSGSSLQAIKKFIASNYKVDSEKLAPFIKKYLKSAVQSGSLVQTKGKGASGSFKLAAGGSTSGSQKKVIKKATFKSKDDLKKSTSASAVVTDKKKKKSTVAKKQAAVTKTKKAVATTEKKSPKAAKSPSKAKK
ncbi:histone H1B-like, partial [Harmonia axyridis]|uniref:histone H1B-like n=1 Tax=Harmonia axyridis TaxID=115357 RepID=UPI001E279447